MFSYPNRGSGGGNDGTGSRHFKTTSSSTTSSSCVLLDDAIRTDLQNVLLPRYIEHLQQYHEQQIQQIHSNYTNSTLNDHDDYQAGTIYQSIFVPFFVETKMGLLLRLQSSSTMNTSSSSSSSSTNGKNTTTAATTRTTSTLKTNNPQSLSTSKKRRRTDTAAAVEDGYNSNDPTKVPATTAKSKTTTKQNHKTTTTTTKFYGYIPTQRCDVDSYIQFIFSIVQDQLLYVTRKYATDNSIVNDSIWLYEVSFYICTYYTFLQIIHPPRSNTATKSTSKEQCNNTNDNTNDSNGINHMSNTTNTKYSFLAIGLQSNDNPKLLYRKYYYNYTKIRITMAYYYTILIQLPNYLQIPTTTRVSTTATTTTTTTAAAVTTPKQDQEQQQVLDNHLRIDILTIIQRLIKDTSKYFDFVSYPGPCSLEGYTFRRGNNNNNNNINILNRTPTSTATGALQASINDDDMNMAQLSKDDSHDIRQQINSYIKQIQVLRSNSKPLPLPVTTNDSSLHRLLQLYNTMTEIPTTAVGDVSGPTMNPELELDTNGEQNNKNKSPEAFTAVNTTNRSYKDRKTGSTYQQRFETICRDQQVIFESETTTKDNDPTMNGDEMTIATTNLDVPDHDSIWTTTTTSNENATGMNALSTLLQKVATGRQRTENNTTQQPTYGDFFLNLHNQDGDEIENRTNISPKKKTKTKTTHVSKSKKPKSKSLPSIVQLVDNLTNDVDLFDDSMESDDDNSNSRYDNNMGDVHNNDEHDDDQTITTTRTSYSMTPGQNALAKLLSYSVGIPKRDD